MRAGYWAPPGISALSSLWQVSLSCARVKMLSEGSRKASCPAAQVSAWAGPQTRVRIASRRVKFLNLQKLSQIYMNGLGFAVPFCAFNRKSPRGRWGMGEIPKAFAFQGKAPELCLCREPCELQKLLGEFPEPSNSSRLCRAQWRALGFLSSPFCYFCSLLLAEKPSCTISPISA